MQNKKNVAVTGLSGVVGKVFARLYGDEYNLIDLYHNKKTLSSPQIKKHYKLDLLNTNRIQKILEKVNPDVVVHMASITHIDKCETDRKNGEKGNVWKINVEATRQIVSFCSKKKIPFVFLSTECVFDGKKKKFNESSKKNPRNWYGVTKSAAEDIIIASKAKAAIIRSVVTYHKADHGKTIYGKVLRSLKNKGIVYAVGDQFFTPTYTEDIVKGVRVVIDGKLTGIFHVVPAKTITPYKFSILIAKSNNFPSRMVKKTSLVSLYGKDRANLRLVNASLSASKSRKILNFIPKAPGEVI
ncbi:MAG TPA: sugar nucleotide-binding protein [Patescibacteria group bacterium]|nr:sugar nucleotide-binding protein [Patescibacteria group bacterium]